MPAPLLLADVPWLLYRSYFALPKSITDADGAPVNALLGTVNALLAALEAEPARAVVGCFGAEQADYRVQLYEPYHAHRDPMPPELAAQWQRAPKLLQALGWYVVESQQLEADDVMFSLARAEEEAGGEALLLTGDRDMYAVTSERVGVLEQKGGATSRIGPAEVRKRYGVEPGQVADFIALRGDPSDGLPGAPGIGAKGAAELLREHGTLEGAIEAARRVSSRMRPRTAAALTENDELLRSFKVIATLQPIELERPPDRATDFVGGAAAARELGMSRLADRLETLAASADRSAKTGMR
jgi:5'-3' exonuclease